MSDQIDPAMDFALRGIVFPPQPHLIGQLMREAARREPDVRTIARIIGSDVTLASSLLKMVNSPFYGLRRKVTSVEESTILIGTRRTLNMATALSLSRSFEPMPGLETFWDDTSRVAASALLLAGELALDPDLCFLMGLFHDSGVLLMMQRYDDYQAVFQRSRDFEDLCLAELENERYLTDHARVGSLFARYWYLPDTIIQAIERHHDPLAFDFCDTEVGNLIAVSLMAEAINADLNCQPSFNWKRMGPPALEQMMLPVDEWDGLKTDIIGRFNSDL